MRYLSLISSCCLWIACTSPYHKLQKTVGDASCVQKFKPIFISTLYKTRVEVMGRKISGLLIIKTMPDSTVRVVFSNEIGFKFFDFEFSGEHGFKVYYIWNQMDKKAVVRTLQKDFELVLMRNLDPSRALIFKDGKNIYFAFPQEKGTNYYITDSVCRRLINIEKASNRKTVVSCLMEGYRQGIPDTIGISHKRFHFDIGLKRLDNHVSR